MIEPCVFCGCDVAPDEGVRVRFGESFFYKSACSECWETRRDDAEARARRRAWLN